MSDDMDFIADDFDSPEERLLAAEEVYQQLIEHGLTEYELTITIRFSVHLKDILP